MNAEIKFQQSPNGGGAFPFQFEITRNGNREVYIEQGISARDYFAAAALTGLMASLTNGNRALASKAAEQCFAAADAMVEARSKISPSTATAEGASATRKEVGQTKND